MEDNKILESLEEFGLSRKEAKVYLTSLELGDATASDISIKSNLPRTLIYDILERLINLGLISYTIKENIKYFRASDPKELKRIVEEKNKSILNILPALVKLQKIEGKKRPKVEIYEGKEGMKTVMDNILRSKTREFLAYGSSKSSFGIIPGFMNDWHKKRAKQDIIMRIIYNDSLEARERVEEFGKTFRKAHYKFMPIKAHFPVATIIYANNVVLQSWTDEPFAVVIENKEMAENQKKYFEELWKIAKK